ncbi:TerD family protein [uncultured Clostridium sp.]|uniref:TerD family protein n=1 Tax=uncultured Clostridium sp. TaxID=59620 RepID=UPI002626216C|nr:TerD family protein [uncultured Clostridium sp.]
MLNLQKNDILNLTKKDPSLNKVMIGAGWDVAEKKGFFGFTKNIDLDLTAFLLNKEGKLISSGIIYFGNLVGRGIRLHGDNLTGAGDGDDEKISIDLSDLPKDCTKIMMSVIIYSASVRKQSFGQIKNAYVRLLNEDKGGAEVCRYNLSESGGDNTGVLFAELEKINGEWNFKAKGEFLKGTLNTIAAMYK